MSLSELLLSSWQPSPPVSRGGGGSGGGGKNHSSNLQPFFKPVPAIFIFQKSPLELRFSLCFCGPIFLPPHFGQKQVPHQVYYPIDSKNFISRREKEAPGRCCAVCATFMPSKIEAGAPALTAALPVFSKYSSCEGHPPPPSPRGYISKTISPQRFSLIRKKDGCSVETAELPATGEHFR